MAIRGILLAVLLCLFWGSAPVRTAAQTLPNVAVQTERQADTPHIPARAIAYQRERRIVGLFGMGWNLLGLWLVLRTGLSARLRDGAYRVVPKWLSRKTGFADETPVAPPFRALCCYLVGLWLLLFLWNLPIGLAGLFIENRFGFARQTTSGYLGDAFFMSLLKLPMGLLLWGGLLLYVRTPRYWWKFLWAGLIPILISVFILQPIVIAPQFNHYTRLPDTPLRAKILALAAKAGIVGAEVYVEDTSRRTSHVNAYVTGIGPTTRIVLNDTALQTLPEDQLLAMMGHEMGHYVEGHLWVGLTGALVGAGFFLWLLARILPQIARRKARIYHLHGITDLAALPLILLLITLFLLLQDPIANGISRHLEHRADAFGLRVTGLNDAMVQLLTGFAERDFADPDPPLLLQIWFGTHPTLAERIAFARQYRAK